MQFFWNFRNISTPFPLQKENKRLTTFREKRTTNKSKIYILNFYDNHANVRSYVQNIEPDANATFGITKECAAANPVHCFLCFFTSAVLKLECTINAAFHSFRIVFLKNFFALSSSGAFVDLILHQLQNQNHIKALTIRFLT